MNVKLKKFKILEPNVKIITGLKIVTPEKKSRDFSDLSGIIVPNLKNVMPDMIIGSIEEV